MSKLDRIMAQIDAGTYKVSAEKIAEKLLKKNPKLSDKPISEVNMKTQIVGDMKGFSVAEYMDEGCTHLFKFDFKYNCTPYGSYLIGLYADGSTITLDFNGDNWRDFEDENPDMEEVFEEELSERMEELGLV